MKLKSNLRWVGENCQAWKKDRKKEREKKKLHLAVEWQSAMHWLQWQDQGSHPAEASAGFPAPSKAFGGEIQRWQDRQVFVEDAEMGRVLQMKFIYWENWNEGVGQDKNNCTYRNSFPPP